MNDTDIAASIERIMFRVDDYLHCELDDDHERDTPASARQRLEDILRVEMLRANAVGLMSTMDRASRDAAPLPAMRWNMPSALPLAEGMPTAARLTARSESSRTAPDRTILSIG